MTQIELSKTEINIIRNAALHIREKSPYDALKMLEVAHRARPTGSLIANELNVTRNIISSDNSYVNLHFGVHKTATTYIQSHLELIPSKVATYTPLLPFRELLKTTSFFEYIKSCDLERPIVISDENLVGKTGEIMSGDIYNDLTENIEKYLCAFSNREYVRIFISIRQMT